MKRQSILCILLLLQVLLIGSGCGSSKMQAENPAAAAEEAAAVTEEAAAKEAAAPMETSAEPAPASDTSSDVEAASIEEAEAETLEEEIIASQKASNVTNAEDVIGIFEGLEDNHTAIFSFDGAEIAFYFDDPAVQTVLFQAVLGSPYTLSYSFDDSLGLDVIYKISE